MKKVLRLFGGIMLVLTLTATGVFLVLGQVTASFTKNQFSENNFVDIMSGSIAGNPRVVDIAMLAAHDAFSNGITRSSKVNLYDGESIYASGGLNNLAASGALNATAGGFLERNSKAQKSGAYELARRGVRYFDARIAEYGESFFACHGVLSREIDVYIKDIMRFLESADGEFIVMEIRHAYFNRKGYPELMNYLMNIAYNGKRLADYLRFCPSDTELSRLRYEDVIDGGAGIVLLAPEANAFDVSPYAYADRPRAVWHNTPDFSKLVKGIRAEADYLKSHRDEFAGTFRINQAQITPAFGDPSEIFRSLALWSLITAANGVNARLIEQSDFCEWLSYMPIIQTDYTDSTKGGFNDKAAEAVVAFNITSATNIRRF